VRASWFALGLTLAAAVALRFLDFDHVPGINGDETVFAVHAVSWLEGAPLSSLRTGTDLPMNPVFFGLVVVLHWLFGTSFQTVRLAALVHSLLALGLVWAVFRRRGPGFVTLLATIVAVLPIHLGYARFAWEAASVPTVLVLGVAASTQLRPWLTCMAFALGLWVHPMTVFSLPILAAPFVAQRWPRADDGRLRALSRRSWGLALLAVLALLLTVVLLVQFEALPKPVLIAVNRKLAGRVLDRLSSPLQVLSFLRLYADLLSGPTIYRYVAGSLSDRAELVHLVAFMAVVGPLLWFSVRKLRAARRWSDLAFTLGIAVSLAAAYVVAGLKVLMPATERYGMFFTVPSCYVLATCVDVLSDTPRRGAWLRTTAAALGCCLLISFGQNYLGALLRPDPNREYAFRTGAVEPKLAALQAVIAMRDARRPAVVLAQDWWIYWPLRYLAHPQPNLHVTMPAMRWDFRLPRDFEPPPLERDRMDLFGIAWEGTAIDRRMRMHALQRIPIRGYGPTPILNVYRLQPR
jgi:hypothetical protein